MTHYCKECESELTQTEAVERYNPTKEVIVFYCPNKECELFDTTLDEGDFEVENDEQ